MKRYYADECCREGWEDARFYLCTDVDALLAKCEEAMEVEVDEWDRGIGSGDITCSDEYRWVNEDRYNAALAAIRAARETI
jgi:hypothetical protein